MINLLILTLIVLATSVVNAFVDNYLIKKKWGKVKNLNHWSRGSIRNIIFWTGYYFLFGFHLPSFTWWEFFKELGKYCLVLFYCNLLFNITFDPLLNYLRNLPWYYDGKDDITDQISNEFQDFFSVEDNSNEFVAKMELGIKIFIILGLEVWILLI